MDRPSARRAPTRTLAQFEDTRDLESVIPAALAARPIDVSMLRRGVWTYVGEERHAGTSPGRVILTLTELIEQANGISAMERQAVMRRVILWSVEAFFSQLGDPMPGPRTDNAAQSVGPELTPPPGANVTPPGEPTVTPP